MDSKIYLINNTVTFNVGTMVLTNLSNNDKATLTRNLAECLFILLNNHGQTISQDFFINEVWVKKRMFISENTLVQNIRKLRAIINSVGLSKEFIVTRKGKGYYFSPDIDVELIEGENKVGSELNSIGNRKKDNFRYFNINIKLTKKVVEVCMIITFIIIFGGELYFCKGYSINAIPPIKYYFNTSLEQCSFFFDNKLGFDKTNIIKIILEQNKIQCSRVSYIYITYYPLSAHYAYIECDQEIENKSEKKTCTSVVRYDYEKNI